jgi:xanthine/CO dehydrogenase XdhC/CoxF family maturation factor
LAQIVSAIDGPADSLWALATVVGVSGSTYRLPGAKQLLRADGSSVGTVSGGCLDADLVRIVGEVIERQQPQFVTYDLSADEDEVWGFGLGCNGVTEIWVEPAVTGRILLRSLFEARDSDESVAAITLIGGPSAGARLFVSSSGATTGGLGSLAMDSEAREAALAAIERGRHEQLSLTGGVPAFVEVQVPPPQLLVCGAGHDAIPLVRYGTDLGWRVTVVDDRSGYLTEARFPDAAALVLGHAENLNDLVDLTKRTDAVVMSHNYTRDVEYLRALLTSSVRYIGMLGPRSRTDRVIDELGGAASLPDGALEKVYAPAGLDIGAEGPEQISWAIMAEVQAVARERLGGSLRDRKGGIHQGLTDGRN